MQGNGYPEVCGTGNTSRNGESCYGLLSTGWAPGEPCDGYPSCNFTAQGRKPAWDVLHGWARRLSGEAADSGASGASQRAVLRVAANH